MSVLDYRPFTHYRDESDHNVGPRPRGENRRNTHRMLRRKLKRADTRASQADIDAQLAEHETEEPATGGDA